MKTRKKAVATAPRRTDGILSIIGLYANVARAYEIATVGNHSMGFAYYSDPNDLERSLDPRDILQITEFYSVTPDPSGDIICDIFKPDADGIIQATERYFETLQDIHERIEKAKLFPIPTSLKDSAESLFKVAIERLGLGVVECENVRKVGATIAQMAFSDVIRAEHIAEAIQYCKKCVTDSNVVIYKSSETLEQINAELLEALRFILKIEGDERGFKNSVVYLTARQAINKATHQEG
jgi:hypothetical protein